MTEKRTLTVGNDGKLVLTSSGESADTDPHIVVNTKGDTKTIQQTHSTEEIQPEYDPATGKFVFPKGTIITDAKGTKKSIK